MVNVEVVLTKNLVYHIQNIAELNRKDRTDLKKFPLDQNEREAAVAKKERLFTSCAIAKGFNLKRPCACTVVKYALN